MPELVIVRHGESQWNLEGRFTGWTDVELTPAGLEQARLAGRALLDAGAQFDLAITSVIAFDFLPLRGILYALTSNTGLFIAIELLNGGGAGIFGAVSVLTSRIVRAALAASTSRWEPSRPPSGSARP